jgi:uncharacterized protein YdhG (YjbR/CyaY superfamily)
MAKTAFKSVQDYIDSQPEDLQKILRFLQSTIRKAVPEADEVISYQIPAYKLDGKPVFYFAGWAHHYSLYPINDRLVAAFQEELTPYKLSKGTIQFPLEQPVPVKLIARMAKFRAKEIVEQRKAAAAK